MAMLAARGWGTGLVEVRVRPDIEASDHVVCEP